MMLAPDIMLNNTPESWTVPPFGPPEFSFPGLALAYAMRSGTVLTGSEGFIETRLGRRMMPPHWRDIADEIEVELVVERGVDRVRCSDIQERIAVGRRTHDRLSANIA